MRKGAVTYLVSGLETGPSIVAVHIRAGWSLMGVEATYMRYAEAGDQTVGRSICGLPTNRPEFAMLPPHFQPNDQAALAAVSTCFGPNLPASMKRVALFALASVVYHSRPGGYLTKLGKKHPLFATPLFTQAGLLQSLLPLVTCRMHMLGDSIRPTGLFAFAELMGQMRNMHVDVQAVLPAINTLPATIVDGLATLLEQRAIGAGTVTTAGLHAAILQVSQLIFFPFFTRSLFDSAHLTHRPSRGRSWPQWCVNFSHPLARAVPQLRRRLLRWSLSPTSSCGEGASTVHQRTLSFRTFRLLDGSSTAAVFLPSTSGPCASCALPIWRRRTTASGCLTSSTSSARWKRCEAIYLRFLLTDRSSRSATVGWTLQQSSRPQR